MSSEITIKVLVFGVFRKYIDKGNVTVRVNSDCSVDMLKKALKDEIIKLNPQFEDVELLDSSVFAKGNHIISQNVLLTDNEEVCVLPPVNGG